MNGFLEERETAWEDPPNDLTLTDDSVHVWAFNRSLENWTWNQVREHLTSEEIQRAEKFLREESRDQFGQSRAVLRQLLARYLRKPAGQIAIQYSPLGRPQFSENPEQDPLRFNLSHSGVWSLFAFRRRGRIGVDLEKVDPARRSATVASRYFSPAEMRLLKGSSGEADLSRFLTLWTLKEAVLKASGEGISKTLENFSVLWNEKTKGFELQAQPPLAGNWLLISITCAKEYRAALALDPPASRIQFFTFPSAFLFS